MCGQNDVFCVVLAAAAYVSTLGCHSYWQRICTACMLLGWHPRASPCGRALGSCVEGPCGGIRQLVAPAVLMLSHALVGCARAASPHCDAQVSCKPPHRYRVGHCTNIVQRQEHAAVLAAGHADRWPLLMLPCTGLSIFRCFARVLPGLCRRICRRAMLLLISLFSARARVFCFGTSANLGCVGGRGHRCRAEPAPAVVFCRHIQLVITKWGPVGVSGYRATVCMHACAHHVHVGEHPQD
jgi:hypothetical protein